jgi:hypothetical protein
MNHLLFALLLLGNPGSPLAKKVDGYLINLTGDTVKCQIRLDGLELFRKVVIYDSAGKSTAYHADKQELRGFGFIYQNDKYDYVLKMHEDSTWDFLIRTLRGKRFALYYSFDMMYTGQGSYRRDSYLIEGADKRVVTVRGGLLSNWKKKVKKFLDGDNVLLDLFDQKAQTLLGIPNFVMAANELD